MLVTHQDTITSKLHCTDCPHTTIFHLWPFISTHPCLLLVSSMPGKLITKGLIVWTHIRYSSEYTFWTSMSELLLGSIFLIIKPNVAQLGFVTS